jgi:hypothetical protein
MNVWDGRTTQRYETIGHILSQLGWDDNEELVNGNFLNGVSDIIAGRHPLPILYMKQNIEGNICISSDQSRDILFTLYNLRALETLVHKKRKISGYQVQVIVFEICKVQDEIINAYIKAGFI